MDSSRADMKRVASEFVRVGFGALVGLTAFGLLGFQGPGMKHLESALMPAYSFLTVTPQGLKYDLTMLNQERCTSETGRGKWVLFLAWATWCQPCRKLLSRFADWKQAYAGRPMIFLTLGVDSEPSAVQALLDGQKTELSAAIISSAGLKGDLLQGVPTLWVVSPQGKIWRKAEGTAAILKFETSLRALGAEPEEGAKP